MNKTMFEYNKMGVPDFDTCATEGYFHQDFCPVRTGDDEYEWTVLKPMRGWRIEIINGTPSHVKSATRKKGTINDFAKFLHRTYKNNPVSSIEFYLRCQPIVTR